MLAQTTICMLPLWRRAIHCSSFLSTTEQKVRGLTKRTDFSSINWMKAFLWSLFASGKLRRFRFPACWLSMEHLASKCVGAMSSGWRVWQGVWRRCGYKPAFVFLMFIHWILSKETNILFVTFEWIIGSPQIRRRVWIRWSWNGYVCFWNHAECPWIFIFDSRIPSLEEGSVFANA